jgi:CubicO group peptidase (beta-lactamase class C family)
MTDLGGLAQETADRLAAKGVGAVVAAVAADSAQIRGAGRTGADREGTPDAETMFEIGSVTKVFTALTLARLAVRGTLDLDEPLVELLPPGASVPSRGGEQIRMRHLATHTSGLPRLPKGMLGQVLLHPYGAQLDPYAECTSETLLEGLARIRLGARPGRRYRYSNLGPGLLGLALAHRAGTEYETLVTREICTPLGLTDTAVAVDGGRSGRLAQGHTRRGKPTPAWQLADLAGAGGLRSTATDLVTFVRAQLDGGSGEIAEAIRLCRKVEHRVNGLARFTVSWVHLGWFGRRLGPRLGAQLQIFHDGATGGFSSFMGFDPEKGVAVIVLTNRQQSVEVPAFNLLCALGDRAPSSSRPGHIDAWKR